MSNAKRKYFECLQLHVQSVWGTTVFPALEDKVRDPEFKAICGYMTVIGPSRPIWDLYPVVRGSEWKTKHMGEHVTNVWRRRYICPNWTLYQQPTFWNRTFCSKCMLITVMWSLKLNLTLKNEMKTNLMWII